MRARRLQIAKSGVIHPQIAPRVREDFLSLWCNSKWHRLSRHSEGGLTGRNEENVLKQNSVIMFATNAVILLVLWLLSLVSSYTLRGYIHNLLVLAIVVILVRVLQGRSL